MRRYAFVLRQMSLRLLTFFIFGCVSSVARSVKKNKKGSGENTKPNHTHTRKHVENTSKTPEGYSPLTS